MTGACDTDITCKKKTKDKILDQCDKPSVIRRAHQSIEAVKLADIKQLPHYVHLPDHVTFYSVLKADADVAKNEPEDLQVPNKSCKQKRSTSNF